jgi:hypothetical protein
MARPAGTDASREACPHRRAFRDIGSRQHAEVAIEFAIGAGTGMERGQRRPITMVE